MSFYRTYRPAVIDEIDNASVHDWFLSLAKKDVSTLPHAYFFHGSKGAGKTTAARVIAKLFNCETPTDHGPCGTCESCTRISSGSYMDVLEIDAASNRGIDEIRDLREKIHLSPSVGKYKIYIIDEVHMLTTEASNALLKTLEEPPGHAVFVLATTDPQKVLSTVKSRCIAVSFRKATDEELIHALRRIITQEKIIIPDDALQLIASYADGAFRDAVKMLEQATLMPPPITADALRSMLIRSDESMIVAFLTSLFAKDQKKILAMITTFATEGKDMKVFLSDCLHTLHTSLLQLVQGAKTEVTWKQKDIEVVSTLFLRAYGEMRSTPIAELPIILAAMEYCEKVTSPSVPVPSSVVTQSHSSGVPSTPIIQKTLTITPNVVSSPPAISPSESSKSNEGVVVDPAFRIPTDTMFSLEKLVTHWGDVIDMVKLQNNSVAGVLRSTRPKTVNGEKVTIEAFYTFHQERLSDVTARAILSSVLKKCFGIDANVEIVLGKK